MNELLDAAKDSESGTDRYEKLKKEEAGLEDLDEAEKRFQELKEKAKKEFVEKQKRKEQEEEEDQSTEEGFITY